MKNTKDITLWGASRFALKLIPLAQQAGFRILYCIDSYHYGYKINDVEVISNSDPRINTVKQSLIVITAQSENGLSAWEKVFNILYNNEEYDNATLLHPSALFEHLKIDLSNKLFMNAIGRSGNLVSSTLVKNLVAQAPERNPASSYDMYISAATDAMSIWENHFLKLFQYMDVSYYNCTMDRLNSLRISGLKDNKQVTVNNIPCLYPFSGPVLSVSIAPTKINATTLTKNGCKYLMPTRHPLDILISQAFYLNKTLSDLGIVKDIGGENTDRDSIAYARLSDKKWVKNTLNLIIDFMYEQIFQSPQAYPIRYESLMNNPEDTLDELSNFCGLELPQDVLMNSWLSIQNKPLNMEHKAHFNSPGTDKWKSYFPREFADLLTSKKLAEVCHQLNYELDPSKLQSHRTMFSKIRQQTIARYLTWQSTLTNNSQTINIGRFEITGTAEFGQFLSIALNSKYFRRLSHSFHLDLNQ